MAWMICWKGAPPLVVEGEITIGRATYSTVWLDDAAVSRTHCRFTEKRGQLVLRDESSNGTFVNGVRTGRVAHLKHGDVVQVATHMFTVRDTVVPDDVSADSEGPTAVRRAVPETLAPPPGLADPQPLFSTGDQPKLPAELKRPANQVPTDCPPARRASSRGEPVGEAVQRSKAPTTEVPIVAGFTSGAMGTSFHVQVIEDMSPTAAPLRYRDAVRLVDGSALCVMTDIIGMPVLSPDTVRRWKTAVRAAGARGLGPNAVLQVLNAELVAVNLQAATVCARLDAKGVLSVACAGAPPPWLVRGDRRIDRPPIMPSVGLGTKAPVQWQELTMKFTLADTLLVASGSWMIPLDETLAANLPADLSRLPDWLRGHPAKPPTGCAICLSMA